MSILPKRKRSNNSMSSYTSRGFNVSLNTRFRRSCLRQYKAWTTAAISLSVYVTPSARWGYSEVPQELWPKLCGNSSGRVLCNRSRSDRCHIGDESPNLSGIGLRCVSCNRPQESSDNSPRCNWRVLYGGATYRRELQCYHLAVKSERQKKQQHSTRGTINNSHNSTFQSQRISEKICRFHGPHGKCRRRSLTIMGVATIHYLHPYRDCIMITYI